VTSEGSALTRFRRALTVHNGPAAYAAATELPRVELADVLALTVLLASEQGNVFDNAALAPSSSCSMKSGGANHDRSSSGFRTWMRRKPFGRVRVVRGEEEGF
jgi:hypothetical protein